MFVKPLKKVMSELSDFDMIVKYIKLELSFVIEYP